jgi:hypothetical protein
MIYWPSIISRIASAGPSDLRLRARHARERQTQANWLTRRLLMGVETIACSGAGQSRAQQPAKAGPDAHGERWGGGCKRLVDNLDARCKTIPVHCA